MTPQFTDLQLDALRELANIGSGTASTALSGMLGRPVDISVPVVQALPFAEAVEAVGPVEQEVTGILLGIVGDLNGAVLLVIDPAGAATLCTMLGVEADSEWGLSALGEIGNIVGASYLTALSAMTGLEMEPTPPAPVTDMLGAIVASALASHAAGADADVALMLDTDLEVEGEDCGISFLLLPTAGGVHEMLARLGLS
ncbi:MAG: Chemotaxis protein CheC -- inhibitor of MCP methylation [uncultured Solirubrobacteraceae bacterium]|uniref:Chemotaxis protein CheC -- inhibitor of MCP methylation n=1 Tax=uncultured Solirubrobacteraceae bacterium TaxID=1162706 RepID=A0A6J4R8H7_9ACTN|nr:MAG: Chemotaxis protein CheC -- inhibitor of MCP methylation [uncultured Solirubrobacteraceae bacterium]